MNTTTAPTNAGRCTETNTNGKRCKRVAYNWPQIGRVLCAPHAYAAMWPRSKDR